MGDGGPLLDIQSNWLYRDRLPLRYFVVVTRSYVVLPTRLKLRIRHGGGYGETGPDGNHGMKSGSILVFEIR